MQSTGSGFARPTRLADSMNRAKSDGPGPRDTVPPARGLTPPTLPPTDAKTTNDWNDHGRLRCTVRVINPLGLHMRAADRFSRAAQEFANEIVVWNGDARADGKNLWDLIALCVIPDQEVVLEVDGANATIVLAALAEILGASNGEDYAN
jgi:phosphocarrier protein HPr